MTDTWPRLGSASWASSGAPGHGERPCRDDRDGGRERLQLVDRSGVRPTLRTRSASHGCSVGSSSGAGPRQVLSEKANRHAAVTDRRGDPPRGARAHITNREHPGPARLDQKRFSIERPPLIFLDDRSAKRRAGKHAAVLVEDELADEPAGRWLSADQHDHRAGGEAATLAGAGHLDSHV